MPDAAMTHTSQFKCVRVVDEEDYANGFDLETHPEAVFKQGSSFARRTASNVTIQHDWIPNSCDVDPQVSPGPNGSSFARIECKPLDFSATTPGVYWMAVDFKPYENPKDYERGCVDQCAEGESVSGECEACSTKGFGQAQLAPQPPGAGCEGGVCDGFGECGACVPTALRCKPGSNIQQTCSIERLWVDSFACGHCAAGVCYSECKPEGRRCQGDTPQKCDATGHWQNEANCALGWLCSGEGTCTQRSDGQACSTAAECKSGTCSLFYRDVDGDGFGQDSVVAQICGGAAPAGYVARAGDCCDSDANANPIQTAYFAQPRSGCGGYDYNCRDEAEIGYSLMASCATGGGWTWPLAGPPSCGSNGPWMNCNFNGGECGCYDQETRTQVCH